LRNKGPPNIEDVDDSALRSLANLAGINVPVGKGPSGEKKGVLDEVISWLRHNDPSTKALEDPHIVEALMNLPHVPVPRGYPKPPQKAAEE
jgi:hypothetical protein